MCVRRDQILQLRSATLAVFLVRKSTAYLAAPRARDLVSDYRGVTQTYLFSVAALTLLREVVPQAHVGETTFLDVSVQ